MTYRVQTRESNGATTYRSMFGGGLSFRWSKWKTRKSFTELADAQQLASKLKKSFTQSRIRFGNKTID